MAVNILKMKKIQVYKFNHYDDPHNDTVVACYTFYQLVLKYQYYNLIVVNELRFLEFPFFLECTP